MNESAIMEVFTLRGKIHGGVYANQLILHPQWDLISLKVTSGVQISTTEKHLLNFQKCIFFS